MPQVPGALSRQGCPVLAWHEWAKIKIDWYERHRSPTASRVTDYMFPFDKCGHSGGEVRLPAPTVTNCIVLYRRVSDRAFQGSAIVKRPSQRRHPSTSKYIKPKAKITVPCLSEIETVRARKIFTSPVIRSQLPWLVLRSPIATSRVVGTVKWRHSC